MNSMERVCLGCTGQWVRRDINASSGHFENTHSEWPIWSHLAGILEWQHIRIHLICFFFSSCKRVQERNFIWVLISLNIPFHFVTNSWHHVRTLVASSFYCSRFIHHHCSMLICRYMDYWGCSVQSNFHLEIYWLCYFDTWNVFGCDGDLQKQSDIGHALKNIVAMDGVRGECIWFYVKIRASIIY